jgi:hypothetical protein
MNACENFLFIKYFLNQFTCFNYVLWTLLYKKILYFQHQIKLPLLNVKN